MKKSLNTTNINQHVDVQFMVVENLWWMHVDGQCSDDDAEHWPLLSLLFSWLGCCCSASTSIVV